jgi:hypothetical protein
VVLLALLATLIIADPGRIDRQKPWLRFTTSAVIALLTLANLYAAGRLVGDIITTSKLYANNATGLLATGGVVWATNVIAFALWYWDLDRGGAAARAHQPQENPAFVFPEMQHTDYTPASWVPRFADYLSLSFWTATAFSPTDISAIKRWARLMMMTEAAVSLVIGVLVSPARSTSSSRAAAQSRLQYGGRYIFVRFQQAQSWCVRPKYTDPAGLMPAQYAAREALQSGFASHSESPLAVVEWPWICGLVIVVSMTSCVIRS